MLNQPIIASSTGGGSSGGGEKYYDYVIHNQEELNAFLKEYCASDTKNVDITGLSIKFIKNKDHSSGFVGNGVEFDYSFDVGIFGLPESTGNSMTITGYCSCLDFTGCFVSVRNMMFMGNMLYGRCNIVGGAFSVEFDYERCDSDSFRIFSWCTLVESNIMKLTFNDNYIIAEDTLMTGCNCMGGTHRRCGYSACYLGGMYLDCCNIGLSCILNAAHITTNTTQEKVAADRSDVELTIDTLNVKTLNYT